MICKKCGQEIPGGSKFCPFCGTCVDDRKVSKATFKDGITALFSKLFVFEGKCSRSEFNYGLLFLMIISSFLSMLMVTPDLEGLGALRPENSFNEMLNLFTSKNIFDSYNLYNIGVSIVYAIFLSGPVFRRLTDIGIDKKRVTIFTVLFVVSQLLCSTLLWCILPTDVYKAISIILDLLSIANLGILLVCIFRSGIK